MRYSHHLLRIIWTACALALTACNDEPPAKPKKVGLVPYTIGGEMSGLAASHRSKNLLWGHNDSFNTPQLFALGTDGNLRGKVRLADIKNIDWEDIAAFELDGQSWLAIADTGDNTGSRKDCSIIIIAEPDPNALSPDHEISATVAWRLPVTFPEGPHDCESMAIDAREETVFLLTKRTRPALLYSLPLRPRPDGIHPTATLITRLIGIPEPNAWQKLFPTPTQRYRQQPTAMSIAPNSQSAAVLTYGDVLFFPRRSGERWRETFSRAPTILPPHGLPQAEALCFSNDSRALFITGEGRKQPLLNYSLPATKTNKHTQSLRLPDPEHP